MTISHISANTLAAWLRDHDEIALLDVREAGEFGQGHLLFAVPLAYSQWESALARRVPHLNTRIVLCDDGTSGVAERAAGRAADMGYNRVHVLAGGTAAWVAAGRSLLAGVNVPSKVFGELVQERHHTPQISAADLTKRINNGDDVIILDSRPFSEYRKMNIPDSLCCPNGELALRISSIAPNPHTTIVINCAGRTRSIIGAQTLIDMGIPNPVYALENGTQGWALAGLALAHGSTRSYPQPPAADVLQSIRARAQKIAERHGVRRIEVKEASTWLTDSDRTTCLLDVRTAEEFAQGSLPLAEHAPGGQLIQAADQFLAVRGCRVLLFDRDGIRAPLTAQWLRRMGWDAHVFAEAGRDRLHPAPAATRLSLPTVPQISVSQLRAWMAATDCCVVDLRSSADYRRGHVPGAIWSIRPKLNQDVPADAARVILMADDVQTARMAAVDLDAQRDVVHLEGNAAQWHAAGLLSQVTPLMPSDAEAIDYLFFVHDRHDGNLEAARRYLAWERGLVAQLHPDERACFKP